MKHRFPDLNEVEKYDSLRFKEDCDVVSLTIPDSKDINGWDICAFKTVSIFTAAKILFL